MQRGLAEGGPRKLKAKRLPQSCRNAKYWDTVARRTIHDDDEPTTQTVIRHEQVNRHQLTLFSKTSQPDQISKCSRRLGVCCCCCYCCCWHVVQRNGRTSSPAGASTRRNQQIHDKNVLAKKSAPQPVEISRLGCGANAPQRGPINQDFEVIRFL